jgi:hypothetical protein
MQIKGEEFPRIENKIIIYNQIWGKKIWPSAKLYTKIYFCVYWRQQKHPFLNRISVENNKNTNNEAVYYLARKQQWA